MQRTGRLLIHIFRGGRCAYDHVYVAAAHAERTDPGQPTGGRRGPRRGFRGCEQWIFIPGDIWVGRVEMQIGGDLSVLQGEHNLNQPSHTGGSLQMPNVGLDCA